jgi:hypothetical protein
MQESRSSCRLALVPQGFVPSTRAHGRRRITPEAGRGIEKLGHAIDYLTDEFVHDGCAVVEDHGRLQAIQLLAALNRQIYFSCGEEPAFREQVRMLFSRLLN